MKRRGNVSDWLPPVLFVLGIVALAVWTIYRTQTEATVPVNPTPQTTPTKPPTTTPQTSTPETERLPVFANTSGRIGSTDFFWPEVAVSGSCPSKVKPAPTQYEGNVMKLANVVQPARKFIGRPFIVNSWYRSPGDNGLNACVGGSPTSQHLTASAMDVTIAGAGQVRGLFTILLSGTVNIACGQVIWYPSRNFVHIALPSSRYPKPTFFVSATSKRYTPVTSVAALVGLGY